MDVGTTPQSLSEKLLINVEKTSKLVTEFQDKSCYIL